MVNKILIIGGGGDKISIILGYLHEHIHETLNVNSYSGCSAGAIVCFLLCIGMQPKEIWDLGVDTDIFKIDKLQLKNIITNMGLQKHKVVSDILSEIMIMKYGANLTLKGLYERTGKNLYIATGNCSIKGKELMSHKTHPNISCIDALEASFTIPGLFEKKIIGDCCYFDGAICDPIPIDGILNNDDDFLILYINSKLNGSHKNIFEYFSSVFDTMQRVLINEQLSKCGHNVRVKTFDVGSVSLRLTKEDKVKLWKKGTEYI